MADHQSYSLYELNEYIKRVMALNFNEPLWIKCEISQVNEVRGNWYLDLIQKDETTDAIIAQSAAVIWYKSFLFIKRKLGELSTGILQNGTEVLLKVKVDYNERYGLKLLIEDIDPSYTIGQLEMNRQKILERLKREGLHEINRRLSLSPVLQHLAVISSPTAAGYKDFCKQLEHNAYGYAYKITFYEASMQGQNTESSVVQAFRDIEDHATQYDAIILIRGGGSKLDLSAFDNYNIAHAIAQSRLPVLVGIGHEIDQSIADIVAHSSLKTPTAVADMLLDRSLHFESYIIELGNQIADAAKEDLRQNELVLQSLTEQLQFYPANQVQQKREQLSYLEKTLQEAFKNYYKSTTLLLDSYTQQLKLVDPINNLKKGYAIVTLDGKTINKTLNKKGQAIEIQFQDGITKAITQ